MYEGFFKLQSRPFPAAPVVANYFPSQSIESARQNLIRAIERAEGPGVVIGPAGVGKTLLLRVLGDQFGHVLRVVMLSGTHIATRKSLLQTILFELKMAYRGMDEGELRLALIDALRHCDAVPNGILLLIDEAHVLPLRLLDEVRLITNVAHDGDPRVRLVLAGNTRMEDRFTHPKLESFNQRIAARCYLQPFSRDETHEYVRAEISWAGGDADSIFTDEAAKAVFRASDGIPRIVNQVCDHALVLAQASGQHRISAAMIQDAWSDLQQLPPPWSESANDPSGATTTVIEFGHLEDSEECDELADDALPTFASESAIANVNPASQTSNPVEWSDQVNQESDGVMVEFDSVDAATNERTTLVRGESHDEPANGNAFTLPSRSQDGMAQNDNPYDVMGGATFEYQTDSVLVSAPFLDEVPEWTNCGENPSPVESTRPLEQNPFADNFEEEVVVIDRVTAQNSDGLRGRPRVSCAEGREIVDALAQILKPENQPTNSGVSEDPACLVPETMPPVPAFEFSTLQDLPEIDFKDEFVAAAEQIVSEPNEQIELDFDEEVDCVPLPWTRGSLGDDRDIIVVEEDTQVEVAGEADPGTPGPRRTEYRELFAQLRRVST